MVRGALSQLPPPQSLGDLHPTLRGVKGPTGFDQNRVPFAERKVHLTNCFLPDSATSHSPYLESATGIISDDLKEIGAFTQQDLAITVFNTPIGRDLDDSSGDESIIYKWINVITQQPVHGEAATFFLGTIQILDFGLRGISALSVLAHRNGDGTGVRIIIVRTFKGTNNKVGYKLELFTRDSEHAVKYAVNWLKEPGPKLVRTR